MSDVKYYILVVGVGANTKFYHIAQTSKKEAIEEAVDDFRREHSHRMITHIDCRILFYSDNPEKTSYVLERVTELLEFDKD